MRDGRLLIPAVLLLGLVAVLHAAKPNILFIITDDQAPDAIGAWGNNGIQTPNMDRLAAGGCSFTHTFNMGAWHGAVCMASRKMLNTGLFLWHAKSDNLDERVESRRMWSQLMHDAGYETYFAGKWHVLTDAENIFDHTGHVRPGMPNQTPAGYNRPKIGEEDQWQPWDKSRGGYWKGGRHWSEVLADEAETFLADAAESDKPFFMYIAFNAPHDPRQSPKSFVDMYPWRETTVPSGFRPRYPFAEEIGAGPSLRDERLAPFPRTEYAVKVHRSEYYALISHTDKQIGRILNALDATDQKDNTYIFMTSDHGLAVGHHGLMGKQNMHWHSMRVPFIVAGPGIKAGRNINSRIYLQDVMPTALELAGAEAPDDVQFRSLLPLLNDRRSEQYDAVYGAYIDLQRMIVDDDWKLILYPKVPKARLYNLAQDPLELNDLADKESTKPIMKGMFAKLLELQKTAGDKLTLEKLFPELCE